VLHNNSRIAHRALIACLTLNSRGMAQNNTWTLQTYVYCAGVEDAQHRQYLPLSICMICVQFQAFRMSRHCCGRRVLSS
jgi:hypothetical protein